MERRAQLLLVTCLLVFPCHALAQFAADPAADLRSRAEAGEAAAQFELGFRLLSGHGAAADTVEAATWYLRAAEQRVPDAEAGIAILYLEGEGVPQDIFASHRWAKRAANHGHFLGYYALSRIHLVDIGDGPDSTYACACAIVAATSGLADLERWRDAIEATLSADDLAWAMKTAAEIQGLPAPDTPRSALGVPSMPSLGKRGPTASDADVRRLDVACAQIIGNSDQEKQQGLKEVKKLAKQGMAKAQTTLGVLMIEGEHVPKDESEAVKWLRKAASQLDREALVILGRMYESGDGVEVDAGEAIRCYTLAASMGDIDASTHMGVAYALGKGVKQNDAEAHYHFDFAARYGQVQSQCRLGLDYALGRAVPRDLVEAYAWLKLSAEGGDDQAPMHLAQVAAEMTGDEVARGDARYVRLRDQVELDRD